MKSKMDVAAIVAVVAVIGSGIGWVISVERRMANRLKNESYYADQQLTKSTLRGESEKLKTELDADVRGLRDRINNFQCPACPPCPKG
ncbi:hypothetical protein [Bacterioplanoides sp.]|uniref:hypothetical protein n=1 Tax=Bacterioplanoides sp. TaxID=2066072 RepID=UPI003B5BAEFF